MPTYWEVLVAEVEGAFVFWPGVSWMALKGLRAVDDLMPGGILDAAVGAEAAAGSGESWVIWFVFSFQV